ncbi:MAG: hypothetical protein MI724_15475, partial [Spirochaetales bacterium]|nr:hypothetical protein [Spirochaetales bacterium]
MEPLRKAALAWVGAILLVNSVMAGGQGEGTEGAVDGEPSGTLVVWSFTDELGQMIEYFEEAYPGVEVEFTVFPNQDEV